MNENLSQLQIIATENAHKHGWVVLWNDSIPQEILSAIQIQSRHLSVGEAIALCHSELSEALEDFRNDNKEHFGEEMADTVIRILHMCGDLEIDLTKEVNQKMLKNQSRPKNHGRVNL